MESKVRLNPVAVSATSGFGRMFSRRNDDVFAAKLNALDKASSEGSVEVITLDSYCRTNGIEFIDLMKIDVEGHEPEVLAGAERLLKERRVGVLVLETNHRRVGFYKSLQDHGFHFFYYNYKNNSLEQIFPVCEKTLLEEPTAFSSNITLIIDEKLSEFGERFRLSLRK